MDRRALGRKNEVVFSDWDEEKIQSFWDQHKDFIREQPNTTEPEPMDPCHIWTGSYQNGYPAVSQGHAKSKIKMHIISAYVTSKRVPASGEVVSHLCHRKGCINGHHLVIESIASNNARKGCLCALRTRDHDIWNLCPHTPPCRRADTDTIGVFVPTIKYTLNPQGLF
jgi:hypothetical protein